MHTLGQIGEALLATGAAWQIRRLTAAPGDRYAADRATLKQHLDELAAEPVRAAIVVLLGQIVLAAGAPALVTGARAREYPEDATLPLAWIRERLLAAKAEQVVVVVSARGEGNAEECAEECARGWLSALATHRPQHVIAADAGDPTSDLLIDALLTGLCGDALDPRTGTVTMASLSEHLARRVPGAALQASEASETLAQPPSLAGFWDVRRSQLAHRAPRPRDLRDPGDPGEPEDLTGTVLPGQFRIDGVLARGRFGTVYRARQLAVERDVAVKVLNPDIDPSSDDGRLFVQEIRNVGWIDHANVVRIHQADITHDGRLFFAMELLDGQDLQALGGGGAMPPERAVELVRQLLAGLGAAHAAGLVHADVKPANAIVVARARSSRPMAAARVSERLAVPELTEEEGGGGEPGERLVLVDFGLARLRAPDRPAQSAGGTPAYMAPEQLHEGRVDARSDLYSAALVLVFLLTGWRRTSASTLTPPLDGVADPALRVVLARALAPDPAQRYQTARALAAALTGRTAGPTAQSSGPLPIVPFRHLAPFTEVDRGRLHGRRDDLALLTEHVLFRRCIVYTAPSGTGKTSMLRAGLLPRLEALGVAAIYLRCRARAGTTISAAIASAIAPGSASVAEAIASWRGQHDRKLVLVLDQLEAALGEPALLPAVLAFDQWPAGADVSVVLSIREDHLARLVAPAQALEPGTVIVRLPPLPLAGAREAIVGPLAEHRLAIEPELLDALLEDLRRAAAALGPELGWGGEPAVYPPHLQLACSVLFEHLGAGEATLSLAHYRRLGGFDAIVGEHLERVLDTELADGRDVIARDLFLALVTSAHERASRPEGELVAAVGVRHGAARVTAVLEVLRARGLLVRVRGADEPAWELVHDSLIPRVLAWLDARDLARRHAIELVRHHLRRSRPGAPSLLDRAELRELRAHADAIAELDAEWRQRGTGGTGDAWTPGRLVARSRQVLRRRALALTVLVAAALSVGAWGLYRGYAQGRLAGDQAPASGAGGNRPTSAASAAGSLTE